MNRSLLILAAVAFFLCACAPPGYMYETGSFVAHPKPELCASRGQVLDSSAMECVTPPPPPPLTPAKVEQSQKANAVTRERNACVAAATKKYELKAEGAVASYTIWRAELKQCEDLMLSQLAAQQMRGADCALKLDWMLRYRMMIFDPDQKAMAEDRYTEICKPN